MSESLINRLVEVSDYAYDNGIKLITRGLGGLAFVGALEGMIEGDAAMTCRGALVGIALATVGEIADTLLGEQR